MGLKVAMIARGMDYGFGAHIFPLAHELERLGVDINVIDAGGNLRAVAKVRGLEEDYDLLHLQGSYLNPLGSKLPTVTTVHTTLKTELEYAWSIKAAFGRRVEMASLEKSDAIIVVNEILRPEVLELVPNAKVFVIPNGVNVSEFSGISCSRREYFLAGGRLIKRKGFEILAKGVQGSMILPRVEIFGDGPLRRSLRPLFRPKDRFLGYISRFRLVAGYRSAMAFVCSSLYETGPITVLEAMAARCPVVCSDIPAVEGLIEDMKTGLLFDVEDPKTLTRALLCIYANPNLRDELASRAFEKVKKERNWPSIARQTLAVYEEVLG